MAQALGAAPSSAGLAPGLVAVIIALTNVQFTVTIALLIALAGSLALMAFIVKKLEQAS